MSDKSFGDHFGRSVVKNPLLSSAMTALSLEDLSHAVLLPAEPLQPASASSGQYICLFLTFIDALSLNSVT